MRGAQSWRGREAMLAGAIFSALVAIAAALAGLGAGALPARVRAGVGVLLLVAGMVQVSATAFAADFNAFLRQLKGFKRASATLAQGALSFSVSRPGPDVTARVRLLPARDRPFAIAFERVRAGGVPLPDPLVDWVVRGYDPSLGLASRLPVRLEVGRVEITPDAIHVAAGP